MESLATLIDKWKHWPPAPIKQKTTMQNEIQKKDIVVSSLEQKVASNGAIRISLSDEAGLKYSYFTTKMDKSPTKAYLTGKDLHVGDKITIGYKTSEGEFQGKKFTRRTALFFEITTV